MKKLPLNIRIQNMKHNYEICYETKNNVSIKIFIECKNIKEIFDHIVNLEENWKFFSIREINKHEC